MGGTSGCPSDGWRGHAEEAAHFWRADVKGADVRQSFASAGIPCVLLKGRAFAQLLYADGTSRPYGDCDLLIPQGHRDRAASVLVSLGFILREGAAHAVAWHRELDGMWVDVHHTLPHLAAGSASVWATLSARAVSISIGGAPTRVLDPASSALLAALHVVNHGPDSGRPVLDLERAVDQLGDDCWRDAAELARQFGSAAELGTGLRLVRGGSRIADRLDLAWAPSARAVLNWREAPAGAYIWESLVEARNFRARLELLVDFFTPPPELLRRRSRLARRGRRGLVCAYLLRPFQLFAKAALSFGPWRRSRRAPSGPPVL